MLSETMSHSCIQFPLDAVGNYKVCYSAVWGHVPRDFITKWKGEEALGECINRAKYSTRVNEDVIIIEKKVTLDIFIHVLTYIIFQEKWYMLVHCIALTVVYFQPPVNLHVEAGSHGYIIYILLAVAVQFVLSRRKHSWVTHEDTGPD